MHTFDRQTDGHTEFSSLDRVCIPCSTVKMIKKGFNMSKYEFADVVMVVKYKL